MSSSYTSQPHYQAGQQPQPAQGYYNQAQAPQGAQGQQWPQYATQQPAAQQQPYTQAPYAQPQQQQAYSAPGYDYAAYYAQQQQWAAYHQQQQQQQQQRQPGQQQAQPQYAQPVQQQPQAQPQYSQHQHQQYAAQQQQQQPPPAAASANSAAYYQQHYAQRQPQQQHPQQQQPQQQQQYQQTVQYQQPQQQQQVYAQPTGAHYAGVQQQHQHPAPVAPAGYPAQQPVAQNPVQPAYTTPQHVVQQAQPVQQNAGYAPATTALHQPQPHAARRPLPSPASGTPPRSPVPPVATGPAPVPAAAPAVAPAPVPVPVPAPASRPPSQSYPNLPNVPAPASSLPRNTSLPSTSTQGSPTKSGGRPLPLAPGGENSPPVTPINVAPPQLPTRAGTLPDGPVRSFRNRRGLPTGGAATPSSILSRGSTLSGSPQKADEPLPNVQRSYTLPTPNTSTRPLPAQPPGSDAPSLTVQQQLIQHQQQQALTQAATTVSSQAAPPRPTVVTTVPTPAQPTEPSPSSARSPAQPRSAAATDIDDRPPPSSRLSRSPLPEPPQQAQRRQSQPPPERTQQQQQPQQRVERPQSQQYHPPPVQPQQQQPPQRLSRIMQMAMQNSSASQSQTQTQNSWPSDLPPLPRPPKPYVHGRIESDDLQDVVAGTLDLELDDAPPQPARPLSRAGQERDLPSVPPSVPEKQGRDRGASVSRGHSPRVRVESMPSSPQISVSGPSIAVRAPSPGIPSVAIRAPSPGVPSISIGGAPSISVSSAPSISVSSAPSINVPAPPMVLSIQLDAPEPGLEATRQRVDVHKLPPVHRAGDTQCGGCGRQLLGRLVSAMDVRWHPQCFKCALCETLLEHVSVFTYEDRPFCHFDYMEHFAPRCHHCKTPIVEEQYITIEDPSQEDGHRFYHEHHFFCAECGDPFIEAKMKTETDEGKEYTMHNNHAYCQKCHINLRYPKCKKCRKPMAENMIEAFGSRWHWECFTCTGCDKPFEDPQMFERDGKPYCLPCFDILIRNDV